MPKFRLKNSVDCDEEQIVKLIKGTNGEHFIAGWKGSGAEKFKANDTKLFFEVMCENKPYGDLGVTWEEDVHRDKKALTYPSTIGINETDLGEVGISNAPK